MSTLLVGKVIKEVREIKNISQEELANGVFLYTGELNYIEEGRDHASTLVLERISDYLSVPVSVLLFMASYTTELSPNQYNDLRELIIKLVKN